MTGRTTMPRREHRFGVWLNDQRTGVLHTRDDYTWFVLDPAYVSDPNRAVLGLVFEEDLKARHTANMRLPPWFSNLLPEGKLREWIAKDRGVSVEREMKLLARIGHDLPGAVRIEATEETLETDSPREVAVSGPRPVASEKWRFSLAGVHLKFSMRARGNRFTAPATGEQGDWIVKLPDWVYPNVPSNEAAMMELARRSGIDVPQAKLVHREELKDVPTHFWPPSEEHAFAIRRFDRTGDRGRIHMEDFAQVRGFYPQNKYTGSFETLANLIYRQHDQRSLLEFVRRLAFCVLIRNGDAHLKNWTLLYKDPRVPVLSPAYDLVSTGIYTGGDEDLGLSLIGSKRFEDLSYGSFSALQRRLVHKNESLRGLSDTAFQDVAEDVVAKALTAWPEVRDTLVPSALRNSFAHLVEESAAMLGRVPGRVATE